MSEKKEKLNTESFCSLYSDTDRPKDRVAYEMDRTAPSFYMILAGQEMSRQESAMDNNESALMPPSTSVDKSQLDEELAKLEVTQEEALDDDESQVSVSVQDVNVHFRSTEEIFGEASKPDSVQLNLQQRSIDDNANAPPVSNIFSKFISKTYI
jgi:hypothetical protein